MVNFSQELGEDSATCYARYSAGSLLAMFIDMVSHFDLSL
jgi:hypothetical protein